MRLAGAAAPDTVAGQAQSPAVWRTDWSAPVARRVRLGRSSGPACSSPDRASVAFQLRASRPHLEKCSTFVSQKSGDVSTDLMLF